MAEFFSIELPIPPRSKTPPLDELHKPVEVIVVTRKGRSLTGDLTSYSENLDSISIVDKQKQTEEIPIDDIKTLQLINSRLFIQDDQLEAENGDGVSMPAERQEFELLYKDGGNEIGETLGHVSDNHGLHLFVAQAFYNYQHLFVPFAALKDHRIGAYIGQILVNNSVVSPGDLNKGLERQSEMRTQKLGDILKEQAIVSADELEKAIKRQQERPTVRLGEALIQEGLITEKQLEDALNTQKQNRSTPLGEILKNMGLVGENELKKTLASKLGIPYVNLKKFNVDHELFQLIPEQICRRHNILPICRHDNKIIVAIENPMNRAPIEDIRFHTKTFVEPIMASAEDIEWAINEFYGSNIDLLAGELDTPEEEDDFSETEINDSDNALVKIVNKMIMDAHQQGASDIHVEPYAGKKKTIIRFRKDGSLYPYVELPASYRNALVSRLKIMCDLDISERRKPQDGKIDFKKFGKLNIELRVATLPTAGGLEDVVLRVLSHGEPLPLKSMGFNQRNLDQIAALTKKPYGLFLVCGPTGSGKTTTLHSILKAINTPDRKIWTAEDPVEITQAGLRQMQVNPKIGLTFATAMRSFLRADPDIIMVGEMRDEETAGTGIEASLTGHMVFSTLHTNSAPESVVRLLDMGMDPFNFADALLGILAQRLTKVFCNNCKIPHFASEEELEEIYLEYDSETLFDDIKNVDKEQQKQAIFSEWKRRFGNDKGDIELFKPGGCDECGKSGYNGRIALHELLVATKNVKHLIQDKAKISDIFAVASSEGMLTLKQDGIEKVLQGYTDMLQVHAVCTK